MRNLVKDYLYNWT